MAWLVDRKAKTDVSDNLGRTPADLAMIRGNVTGAMAAAIAHESPDVEDSAAVSTNGKRHSTKS